MARLPQICKKETKMKFRLYFLFCFLSLNCFSQIKIELTKTKDNRKDYIFNKPSDSIYLKVGHHEDMGAWYGFYFEFKKSVPDGEYEVYVNDKIKSKGLIKSSCKQGFWREYNDSGELVVVNKFKNGNLNGKTIHYHKNKKTKRIAKYKNGKAIWYENYNEDGKLVSKTYLYE